MKLRSDLYKVSILTLSLLLSGTNSVRAEGGTTTGGIEGAGLAKLADAGKIKPYCKDKEAELSKAYKVEKKIFEQAESARIAANQKNRAIAKKVLSKFKKIETFLQDNKVAREALQDYQAGKIDEATLYAYLSKNLVAPLNVGFEHPRLPEDGYYSSAFQSVYIEDGKVIVAIQEYQKASKELLDERMSRYRQRLKELDENDHRMGAESACRNPGYITGYKSASGATPQGADMELCIQGVMKEFREERATIVKRMSPLYSDNLENGFWASAIFDLKTGKSDTHPNACMDEKTCDARKSFSSFEEYLNKNMSPGCFFTADVIDESLEKNVSEPSDSRLSAKKAKTSDESQSAL